MKNPPFHLPPRPSDSHKGDYGKVLLIGGSRDMPGSITMSALAALRSGAGLVKVAVPASAHAIVAAASPCFMPIWCADQNGVFAADAEMQIAQHVAWADVIAIGPGMDVGNAQREIVLGIYRNAPQAVIVDADALNAMSEAKADFREHDGPRILTPHTGEFSRMTNERNAERRDETQRAKKFSANASAVVVLKGHQTFVTDGKNTHTNSTGNPGMATGGSGDVLTGIIAAYVGIGISPFEGAALAVHVHGLAGDVASHTVGQTSLIATDIINALPNVHRQLESTSPALASEIDSTR